MQKQIEQLVRLQALELERGQLDKALRALPMEVAHAEAELKAALHYAAETGEALNGEEANRTRLEKEIAVHRQKAARYRAQLDTVTTPAQAEAMEKEIHFADSEAERLENEEFASLERTEAMEKTLTATQTVVETKTGALEKIKARAEQRKTEFSQQLAKLGADREALRPLIDESLLMRFDRLAASRGTGLAKAENQRCMACQISVRPQMWNQLREGELLSCDSCGRMLYWDPDMTPAEK